VHEGPPGRPATEAAIGDVTTCNWLGSLVELQGTEYTFWPPESITFTVKVEPLAWVSAAADSNRKARQRQSRLEALAGWASEVGAVAGVAWRAAAAESAAGAVDLYPGAPDGAGRGEVCCPSAAISKALAVPTSSMSNWSARLPARG